MSQFWNDPDRICAPPIGATPEQEGYHTDQWFPYKQSRQLAKKLCEGCPTATKNGCLEYAIENGEEGIWGGMCEEDRNKLGRKRQAGAA